MPIKDLVYKVPGLSFDVNRLVDTYREIKRKKEFDQGDGSVSHIDSISLNKIPGNDDSTSGKYSWGLYWTKPDSSGQEVARADYIEENNFTEFLPEFENTYFKFVYDILSRRFALGRTRILKKGPRSTLSWHKDPEPRLHIPIITNPGCRFVIEDRSFHLPADGGVWIVNAKKYHNFFNGGEEDRIHLVATLPHSKLFTKRKYTYNQLWDQWVS
ncbi:aspartyl/asparaginyl beta-hydroxylase domain-containing protein [Candidatus Pelagibacter bacterium nBUS_30]|uniref:aspartyl/asparaginyl beta-hydroxylase domain-containing protein n=1 Tax=Candidatus Pelagibacter bacterium nBUS_30 TaxID=3374191 RepID=UPI003EC14DD5